MADPKYDTRATLLASLIVVGTGALWGFYWVPVRFLTAAGLSGAWGTLAITMGAVLALAPFVRRRVQDLRQAQPLALASIALGGAAFALYSVGFVYGRVAIIILLFFLTPVWSTLIGRVFMGWSTGPLRIAAIGVGVVGLAVMLGAKGEVPMPRGLGEWLALASGLLWAVATTGIRVSREIPPVSAAFVFASGAALATLAMMLGLGDTADVKVSVASLGLAGLAGALWWGASMAALMWATARLDPARVGILLMAEVLIGAGSAAVFAGEHLSGVEMLGGALVLVAGVLEVWPSRSRA